MKKISKDYSETKAQYIIRVVLICAGDLCLGMLLYAAFATAIIWGIHDKLN